VTEAELGQLLDDCPTLYHMAQRQSWPKIRKHGLLSTTALLDRYGLTGVKRQSIEAQRRPISVTLEREDLGRAVIRDQSPMDDNGLVRCLQDGLSPQDWYRLLNSKVFFWLTRARLLRLLNAGTYRSEEHDVLELEASQLVTAYKDRILLFCVASDTEWELAGITGATVIVRGLIERDAGNRLALTEQGRAVLTALIG
jgi:hypothetical protein